MRIPKKISKLQFNVTIGCPLNCDYCPQKLHINNYYKKFSKDEGLPPKYMSFVLFKNVLDKMYPPDKDVIVGFSPFCEPFTNPETINMISYASEKGYYIFLSTTLTGLNIEDISILEKYSHLIFATIHIPDEENHSKFKITDNYLEILERFHNAKINIEGYSCHGTVHHKVKGIINQNLPCQSLFHDRCGILKDETLLKVDKKNKGKLCCCIAGPVGQRAVGLSENFVVLPNGEVSLCCNDFPLQHIIGNIADQTYEELCNDEKFKKILYMMDDESIESLCRTCIHGISRYDPNWKDGICSMNLLSLQATKTALFMEQCKKGDFYNIPYKSHKLIAKLAHQKKYIIYGLGKLFTDHYFPDRWFEVFPAEYFVDENPEKYSKEINGIPVISPEELYLIYKNSTNKENVFVITWVKNDIEIRANLLKIGITNICNAYEIFNLFD